MQGSGCEGAWPSPGEGILAPGGSSSRQLPRRVPEERTMRMNPAQTWILGCMLLIARPSAASRDIECTGWRLDAPTPVADGGLESTQCSCLGWIQYGDPPPPRYACDLCAPVSSATGGGTCLRTGATLPEGCSHTSGGSVVAAAVMLLWLVRRGCRQERVRSTSNARAQLGQAGRVHGDRAHMQAPRSPGSMALSLS